MYRVIRKRLRQIRYHSARQERTVWTNLMDAMLFAAPLLGIALALLCHAMVETSAPRLPIQGVVARDASGRWGAALAGRGDPIPRSLDAGAVLLIEFEVVDESRLLGWPLHSAVVNPPHSLEATFADPTSAASAQSGLEDPEARGAIATLLARKHPEAAEGLRRTTPEVRTRWYALVGNAALWWFGLTLLLPTLLLLARFIAYRFELAADRRAARMRRKGLCPSCGFDVRGSYYSERCPECGELLE